MGPEIWDFWWESRTRPGIHLVGETRDPSPWDSKGRTRDPRPETQPIDGTRGPGPETLKVGPKIRDPGHLFYIGSKTQDPNTE